MSKRYKVLQDHYESCLTKFGPNEKGMDWPNAIDLEKRFRALTPFLNERLSDNVHLLDLGCGVGLLLKYLKDNSQFEKIVYTGLDISEQMIQNAKEIQPEAKFIVKDILEDKLVENSYDYIVMNGLFTEKREMSQLEMISFFEDMIFEAYKAARVGISFNLMSSHVDWKRDDLFHVELDFLVAFLIKNFSRRITINMDYGLYEYAVTLKKS
ncbi:class I SAM-dependent methyltransferase [Peijinzhouia sedimentorum]